MLEPPEELGVAVTKGDLGVGVGVGVGIGVGVGVGDSELAVTWAEPSA